jgi:hypothetical protein
MAWRNHAACTDESPETGGWGGPLMNAIRANKSRALSYELNWG